MAAVRPLPTVIGPTETALRALLTKTLASTQIPGYSAWVILNVMSNADGDGTWRQAVASALRSTLTRSRPCSQNFVLAG